MTTTDLELVRAAAAGTLDAQAGQIAASEIVTIDSSALGVASALGPSLRSGGRGA